MTVKSIPQCNHLPFDFGNLSINVFDILIVTARSSDSIMFTLLTGTMVDILIYWVYSCNILLYTSILILILKERTNTKEENQSNL